MASKRTSAVLGLDIGTSGVKALLIAASGDVLASSLTPLTLSTPRPGWAEQDPEAWWDAAVTAIRRVVAQQPDVVIDGIGISGQMHSAVLLDGGGRVIRPALLWCDGRTSAECAEITALAGGEEQLREWVRNPALEGFTLPKILWLRNHEPEAYARLSRVLLAKDFIRYRLTGVQSTEPSDASGTLMFDPAGMRWSASLLASARIPRSLLPDVGGSAAIHGHVSAAAAALTGVTAGTPVIGGGADNACGAAGVGALTPGDAVASWGTSGTVLAPTSQPLVDPQLRAHTFCHVAPDTWYLMGVVLSAGGAFGWFQEQLARDVHGREDARQRLDAEAAAIPPGADGVTFLPYMQGERTPHRDASARGALLGLSLAHTRAHLTRAVLEGVCFALNDSLAVLREVGLRPGHMLLTGGGARSALIRRLLSEIFGLPVTTVDREEGPAYGAAMLAGVGVGIHADLGAAAAAMLVRAPLQYPAEQAVQSYREPYARFRHSYRAARPPAS